MASKDSHSSKLNVVIVGGGMIGAPVAHTLSAKLDSTKYNIILIDQRPFRIILPPALRTIVTDEGHLEDKILVPFDKVFVNGNGTFIQGTLTSVIPNSGGTGGSVALASGEKIEYATLILGTGGSWSGPLAFPNELEDTKAFINGFRAKVAKAKSVVLIGGGAVGLELAGEIKDISADKEVTVIHANSKLLNDVYPDKYRLRAEQSVKARGIKVTLNELVDNPPESGTFKTRSGKEFTADLIVPTWGFKISTPYLSPSTFELSPTGEVKILPTFQLVNHPDIFAGGDIIDWKEQKQAAKAMAHATTIAANVIKYLDGAKNLAQYKGSYEMILVTNGKNGGYGYLGIWWGIMLGDFFARLLKSRNLMIPKGGFEF